MRLFVALELPAQVREAAAGVIRELKSTGADVKWVRPEAMHLTLKFLGEVAESRLADLEAALTRACWGAPALDLAISGAGAFPSPNKPQVVWLGVSGMVAELKGLAAAIDREMAGLGFEAEKRPFRAHLTLGRLRRSRGRGGGKKPPPPAPLSRALAGLTAWQGPQFTCGQVVLMQSTLKPSGAEYSKLFTIALT